MSDTSGALTCPICGSDDTEPDLSLGRKFTWCNNRSAHGSCYHWADDGAEVKRIRALEAELKAANREKNAYLILARSYAEGSFTDDFLQDAGLTLVWDEDWQDQTDQLDEILRLGREVKSLRADNALLARELEDVEKHLEIKSASLDEARAEVERLRVIDYDPLVCECGSTYPSRVVNHYRDENESLRARLAAVEARVKQLRKELGLTDKRLGYWDDERGKVIYDDPDTQEEG